MSDSDPLSTPELISDLSKCLGSKTFALNSLSWVLDFFVSVCYLLVYLTGLLGLYSFPQNQIYWGGNLLILLLNYLNTNRFAAVALDTLCFL